MNGLSREHTGRMTRVTAKRLAEKYAISAEHALYRETGDWYHVLNKFPGVLFDKHGYIFFPTQEDYEAFVSSGEPYGVRQNIENNWLTIQGGISSLPGYQNFEGQSSPDEIPRGTSIKEGAVLRVNVNRYERDPGARRRCIEHFGCKCSVCDFDFNERFGDIGAGFVHVHHLTPISSIGDEYLLDPIQDLRPVCPNCHAMLHRKNPPFSIEEMKQVLRKHRK